MWDPAEVEAKRNHASEGWVKKGFKYYVSFDKLKEEKNSQSITLLAEFSPADVLFLNPSYWGFVWGGESLGGDLVVVDPPGCDHHLFLLLIFVLVIFFIAVLVIFLIAIALR